MKAYISKRAARAAERISARWNAQADDPDLFARELLATIELLETTPGVGVGVATPRHATLKRVLMRKSRCHLYFKIDETQQRIEIVQLWDGRRGTTPKL